MIKEIRHEGRTQVLFLSLKTEHPCWTSLVFLYIIFFFFNYLALAVLGLCCCVGLFSSCGERASSIAWAVCSLRWLLLLGAQAPRAHGLRRLRLSESRAQAQHLWPSGPVTPQYVESSRMKDRASVSCAVGRWTLHPLEASRESPTLCLLRDSEACQVTEFSTRPLVL